MKPPSILDPNFHYVPSTQTDIRKTFARVRRELAKAKAKATQDELPAPLPAAKVAVVDGSQLGAVVAMLGGRKRR